MVFTKDETENTILAQFTEEDDAELYEWCRSILA